MLNPDGKQGVFARLRPIEEGDWRQIVATRHPLTVQIHGDRMVFWGLGPNTRTAYVIPRYGLRQLNSCA